MGAALPQRYDGAQAPKRPLDMNSWDLSCRLDCDRNLRCEQRMIRCPRGFDTLTLVGRSLFAVCRRLSHSGRVVPGVMSRSTEAAEGGTRDEVSLDVEDVVNGGVDGDEALG